MTDDRYRLRKSILITLAFVFLIWLIKIVEFTFDLDFAEFGILPRTLHGSMGIFTAPLIHGDAYHLISNTVPILILGVSTCYFYDRIAVYVIALIYLITGFWVWVAARDAYHIGASGLIYGLLTFLLFSGFFRKDNKTLAVSLVVLFLYGTTLFTGVIPTESMVSWESHLMGALAGIFCAIYFKSSKTWSQLNAQREIEQQNIESTPRVIYSFKMQKNDSLNKHTFTYKRSDRTDVS